MVSALVFGDDSVEHGSDALASALQLMQDERRNPRGV
jgi:hypothetical protein